MSGVVLIPEPLYPDEAVERAILGPDCAILRRSVGSLSELSDEDCAGVDGLMLFRLWMPAESFARFPRLRVVVRMGVGYDRIDRAAAAAAGVTLCNVPDYGTTEIADHAIALALALRRGLLLHHDAQRGPDPRWAVIPHPIVRRSSVQGFGVVGLGRIGMATALRAKALGFQVQFYDPFLSNGTELGVGVARQRTLEGLLERADVLSIHVPATPATRNIIDAKALARLPRGTVVVNTSRGSTLDLDALEAAMRSGHIAGAGLDVLPVEPPVEPLPKLLAAYRAREDWLNGRLIVTPHAAYWSPEADLDIRVKAAETMAAALSGHPQNVIAPD